MAVTLTRTPIFTLFFSERFHFRFALACVIGMFAGLVLSRGILSVSMIAMIINGIIYWTGAVNRGEKVWEKVYGIISLFFIVYALSGFYSDDKIYWLERLQVKLPFLLLPIGFLPLKKLDRVIFYRLLSLFVVVMWVSSANVLVNYFIHRSDITYWTGEVMNTPFSHVRFSLMIAFAAFASFHLFAEKFQWLTIYDKWLLLGLGLMLTIFLHVLAVRSGLVAFYFTAIILVFRYAWINGRWVSGLAFISGFMLLPVIAYVFVPTFHEKINYMRYTFSEFLNGADMTNLSDGQRLTSIQKGFDIFQNNVLIGVGAGDLPKATEEVYNNSTNQGLRMPHNQWVWCLASVGLVGTLIIAFSLFYPIYYLRHDFNLLTISFFTIILTSLLTEATFEEQIGSAFYLLFLLLFISLYNRRIT